MTTTPTYSAPRSPAILTTPTAGRGCGHQQAPRQKR